MSIAVEPIHISDKEGIGERIISILSHDLQTPVAESKGASAIVRAEIPVTGLNALSWLCRQSFDSRGYWSDRENAFELAGVGGADVITGDSELDYHGLMKVLHERLASARGNPRYFGGLRFSNGGSRDSAWAYFKAYRFILPRFEVFCSNGRTTFACNMIAREEIETVERAFAQLSFSDANAPLSLPMPVRRQDNPDLATWRARVSDALKSIEIGAYEKVVLARRVTFEFSQVIDAAHLLHALSERTSKCFHFLFQPHRRVAFVGASPESLYRRDGGRLTTEAIAGSRPRGMSEALDQNLARQLMGSEKELREHRYVIQGIEKSLGGLCGLLLSDEQPGVLKLSRCQHLITRFRGALRSGVKDADLLVSLHPTPAVGGFPTRQALKDIRRLESFDRGWYAGPVGWISKYGAQFAVGIRSGLCDDRRLHLFSGAGLVGGSVPDAEWAEVENKIGDFVNLLTAP
jgi:menaquinone-specific isochorismate synthase